MSNQTQKLKILFAGTPDFALPALEGLIKDDFFEILAVITQPDKKSGRGQTLKPTPVKELALRHNLPVWQPAKITEIKEKITETNPDLVVVVAYGQIIPQNILDLPKLGFVNLHASLLPQYRGASVIAAPILNGDKYTGVTVMKMEAGLDTGPIIKQNKIKLEKRETLESLHDKLAKEGAKLLTDSLKEYTQSKITPQKQEESKASYAPKTTKEEGEINWEETAELIEKKVRAFNPFPGTYTKLGDKFLKIKKVKPEVLPINKFPPGKIFLFKNDLAVQCGQNALVIERLQPEGKREMSSQQFLQGHGDVEGMIFSF